MIAYHICRSDICFEPGTILTLKTDYQLHHNETPIISELFPNGLSRHGIHYLSDAYYASSSPYTHEDFYYANVHCSNSILEYSLEFVRRSLFCALPSRFVSIFGLEHLNDINSWPELINQKYKIYEIEYSSCLKLDASYLKGGICFNWDTPIQFHQGFSPLINLDMVYKYWSGDFSNIPKPELIIPLPVTVKSCIYENV